MRWFIVIAAIAGMLLVAACGKAGPSAAPTPGQQATSVAVVKVEKANVRQVASFTGDVKAQATVAVQPKEAGRLVKVAATVGQAVQAGDVLAQIDHSRLDLALEQAQAQLQQAQAKLSSEQAGPTAETVAEAQLAVQNAQSRLQTMLNGPKPATVAGAQAAVAQAQAGLDAAQQKVAALQNPRPESIAQAQANVTAAQQALDALQHPRPASVAQVQLAVDQAKQKLATIQAGPRPEVVAQAQASLQKAQASLAALKAGPTAPDLQPLRVAVDQAKNSLFSAQVNRDAVCGQVGKPIGIGVTGSQARCDAANAQVSAAQAGVDQAQASLTKAQQPPAATDLTSAQAAVDQAQAAVDQAQHPFTPQDLQQAQDAVNTAEQQLALAQQPGSPQDVAKAQAAVQQAQAGLALAQHPGSAQELAEAQDAVRQEQAALVQAQQNLTLAQQPYTNQDIEQAQIAVETAKQQLSAAQHPYTQQDIDQVKAAVAQAQAGVDQAAQNVKDATVTAPVGGIVTAAPVSEGALVTTATTLVTLASQNVDVEVSIPEGQMSGITVGKPATITPSTAGGTPIDASVSNVAPSADPQSRTFAVRVTPSGSAGVLRPGTFAGVTITPTEHKDVLAVPSGTVVERNGKSVVFVVRNGIAKETPVTAGLVGGQMTELTAGVAEGDQVVNQGQDTLGDGDHVTVTNPA